MWAEVPLGILLAAAWVEMLSPAEIAAEVQAKPAEAKKEKAKRQPWPKSLSAQAAAVQAALADLKLPRGYGLAYTGENEAQEEAQAVQTYKKTDTSTGTSLGDLLKEQISGQDES